jgi:hypothetical protein
MNKSLELLNSNMNRLQLALQPLKHKYKWHKDAITNDFSMENITSGLIFSQLWEIAKIELTPLRPDRVICGLRFKATYDVCLEATVWVHEWNGYSIDVLPLREGGYAIHLMEGEKLLNLYNVPKEQLEGWVRHEMIKAYSI